MNFRLLLVFSWLPLRNSRYQPILKEFHYDHRLVIWRLVREHLSRDPFLSLKLPVGYCPFTYEYEIVVKLFMSLLPRLWVYKGLMTNTLVFSLCLCVSVSFIPSVLCVCTQWRDSLQGGAAVSRWKDPGRERGTIHQPLGEENIYLWRNLDYVLAFFAVI